MSGPIIMAVLASFAVAWGVATYNRLVVLARRRDEAWSGVLVQLKRRHDLVPNLVAAVRAYAAHESKVLEEVTAKRDPGKSSDPVGLGATEQAFSHSLTRLLAVAGNYPKLKADRNFGELQNSLVRIEDDIQMSRRYYNGTVRNYNTLIASFPSMLVARTFSFAESPFFELESPSEAETPTVSFNVRD